MKPKWLRIICNLAFFIKIVPDKSVPVFYKMKINVKYLGSIILKSLHSITTEKFGTNYKKY